MLLYTCTSTYDIADMLQWHRCVKEGAAVGTAAGYSDLEHPHMHDALIHGGSNMTHAHGNRYSLNVCTMLCKRCCCSVQVVLALEADNLSPAGSESEPHKPAAGRHACAHCIRSP